MQSAKIITAFPSGTIALPPSKSYSHRALICAFLAALTDGGISHIDNLGSSQDIAATRQGVHALGGCCQQSESAVSVTAGGPASTSVDCGESGSTLRFFIPIAAALREETRFTGRGKLMERPLGIYERLFAITRQPGAVTVAGRLRSGVYELPGDISSQFVSGLLLALPLVGGGEVRLTTPLESRHYVDMTVAVMARFGVAVEMPTANHYCIHSDQRYHSAAYSIEADFSQAAFFLGAAALGRNLRCAGLNLESLQGDRQILSILGQMGATITQGDDGLLTVRADVLRAVDVDAREIPDLIPPVAALCCFCRGESHITGAARLRIKESDRLAALARELSALGADIVEGADSLTIRGAPTLPGGNADAWNDHRIAMAVAVAAIRCTGPVTLTGWQAIKKSYPHFWQDFEQSAKEASL